MKHLRVFFLVISFVGLTSVTYTGNSKLQPGFYYLAAQEEGAVLIQDIDDGTTYAIDKEPAIVVTDFAKAKITNTPYPDKKAIRVALTPEGRKKWRKALDRIIKTEEGIMFICNDKIYMEKRMLGQKGLPLLNQSAIYLYLRQDYLEFVLDQLQQGIPPKK